jgi:hypothetical protein
LVVCVYWAHNVTSKGQKILIDVVYLHYRRSGHTSYSQHIATPQTIPGFAIEISVMQLKSHVIYSLSLDLIGTKLDSIFYWDYSKNHLVSLLFNQYETVSIPVRIKRKYIYREHNWNKIRIQFYAMKQVWSKMNSHFSKICIVSILYFIELANYI